MNLILEILFSVLIVILSFWFPLGDSFLFKKEHLNSYTLIEVFTNSYYKYWLPSFINPFYYLIVLTFLTTFLWLRLDKTNNLGIKFLSGAVFSLTALSVTGLTLTTLCFCSGLFIYIIGIEKFRGNKYQSILYLSVATLVLQKLSILAAICALLNSLIFFENREKSSKTVFFYLFALSSSMLIWHIHPDLLNLPVESRFVPGYGTAYGVTPLVGVQPEFLFMNRIWIEQRVQIIGIFICLIGWALSISNKLKLEAAWTFALGVISLCSSSLMPINVRMISPCYSLMRMWPDLILLPVPILFGLFGVFVAIKMILKIQAKPLALGSLILPLLLTYSIKDSFFGTIKEPKSENISYQSLSPSLYIIKENLALPPKNITDKSWISIKPFIKDCFASDEPEKLKELLSNQPDARWSTKLGKQTGKEWIELILNSTQKISGISISTPNFFGDYPRGVDVFSGTIDKGRCKSKNLVYTDSVWQGAVIKEGNGLYTLSGESIVKLYFNQSIETQCINIFQTGISDSYEWGIEDIRIISGFAS